MKGDRKKGKMVSAGGLWLKKCKSKSTAFGSVTELGDKIRKAWVQILFHCDSINSF